MDLVVVLLALVGTTTCICVCVSVFYSLTNRPTILAIGASPLPPLSPYGTEEIPPEKSHHLLTTAIIRITLYHHLLLLSPCLGQALLSTARSLNKHSHTHTRMYK